MTTKTQLPDSSTTRAQDGERKGPGAWAPQPGTSQRYGNSAACDALRSSAATPSADASVDAGLDADVGADTQKKAAPIAGPTVATIGTEHVRVATEAEATEAARMLKVIKDDYGIDVNSQAGVDALKAHYDLVPASELNKLATRDWEYEELASLFRALSHFAPILGAKRATSPRSGDPQEVTSVAGVQQSIDRNSRNGVLDTTTLGEYFKESKNFSMFKAGTTSTVDFPSHGKQMEGTAIHEIAHGLMANNLPAYITATGFWMDKYTPNGTPGAEIPVTQYGGKNASEDLSEAVMYFFVEPATLQTKCPRRHAFIDGVVKAWSARPPAAP